MRIFASEGERQPASHIAIGEATISTRANSTYDGATATLNSAQRAIDPGRVRTVSACQTATTGAAATAQTTVCTNTSDPIVQAIRHAPPAGDTARSRTVKGHR